jgi:hypothetical protein
LVVLYRTDNAADGHVQWQCRCQCGAEKPVRAQLLILGAAQSCGCLQRELSTIHGHHNSLTYSTWENMIQRCTNVNYRRYKDYGGRGITVYKRWLKFKNFLTDMGERPPGTTLDRKDNNKGYYKANCRWATKEEQANNTSRNRFLLFNGRRQTIIQWSRELHIPRSTIWVRLNKHPEWPIDKILAVPRHKERTHIMPIQSNDDILPMTFRTIDLRGLFPDTVHKLRRRRFFYSESGQSVTFQIPDNEA